MQVIRNRDHDNSHPAHKTTTNTGRSRVKDPQVAFIFPSSKPSRYMPCNPPTKVSQTFIFRTRTSAKTKGNSRDRKRSTFCPNEQENAGMPRCIEQELLLGSEDHAGVSCGNNARERDGRRLLVETTGALAHDLSPLLVLDCGEC
jgi:hypothetical protein